MSDGRKHGRRWLWLIPLAVLLLEMAVLFSQQGREKLPDHQDQMGLILREDEQGLYVMAVAQNSPASEAGIHPGDVIIRLNGTQVQDGTWFEEQVWQGERELQLLRGESELTLKLTPWR